MHKRRFLLIALLVFSVMSAAGRFFAEHLLTVHDRAGTALIVVTAFVLSMMTYLLLVRSEWLRCRAADLMAVNRRLEDEILQRRAAEERSANMAREWANTFDSITDCISVHSNEFRIIRTNRALLDYTGMSKEQIAGRHCYEIFHRADSPVPDCPHVKTMNTRQPVTVERYDPLTNHHLLVSTSPIFNSSQEMIGTVHIAKDITEIKKLEEQLYSSRKLEAVGRLAAGVAHDFNNILSAVINYVYLLKDTPPQGDRYMEFVEEILSLSIRASSITQNLLAYGRQEPVDLRPLDLNLILKNMDQLIYNLLGRDINLESILSDRELIILGDANSLEQCVINLASNARDAMPEGGRLIFTTGAVEIDADFIVSNGFGIPGTYALLSVTDTGTGMNEETRQKIFEPFFSTKEVGKGTGLGLSMIYGITKQHRGYIAVSSRQGQGTTFRLYFPLAGKNRDDNGRGADCKGVRDSKEGNA